MVRTRRGDVYIGVYLSYNLAMCISRLYLGRGNVAVRNNYIYVFRRTRKFKRLVTLVYINLLAPELFF